MSDIGPSNMTPIAQVGPLVSEKIEALKRAAPDLRDPIDSFLLGIYISSNSDDSTLSAWRSRLEQELQGVSADDPGSIRTATLIIELLKREFAWIVIRPRAYRHLLYLWLGTIVAVVSTYALIGDGGFFDTCSRWPIVNETCMATYGHFFGYISFRYAAFGVLIGIALLGSSNIAGARFAALDDNETLLSKPPLRAIIASVIAYILCLFIASGKFEINLLGFRVAQDISYETKCTDRDVNSCGPPPPGFEGTKPIERQGPDGKADCCFSIPQPGFRDAVALFAIGISAAIATEIYLHRIVEAMRGAAESAFKPPEAN
jgi:hypothetical protein